jgi:glycosyltransferase involved in cell wall biosynthesis
MSDGPPLVSICIPTYNREASVARAVVSALGQSYNPIEVVVVDDASTDDTCAKLRELDDGRLRLHRNARRLGQIANRNRAVALCRGELIKFLDDDDTLEPDCVALMAGPLCECQAVGLAFCRRMLAAADEPSPEVNRWIAEYGDLQTSIEPLEPVMDGPALLRRWIAAGLARNWIGEPTAVMARRDVILASGGFDHRTRLTGDMGLWARIMAHHDVAFIDLELATFQVGIGGGSETSASLRGNGSWLNRLWMLEALAADETVAKSVPELGPALHWARREAWRTTLKLGRSRGQRYPLAPYARYVLARAEALAGHRHAMSPAPILDARDHGR